MPAQKIISYLNENQVKYEVLPHTNSYTARESAHLANIPEKEMAKAIMLKVDERLVMAVLPSSQKIDTDHFKKSLGAIRVELADENDFSKIFPDCEIGAMPPFGNLYDIDVFVAESLTKDKDIAFNAGTHHELIKMSFDDYKRLVKPKIINFTTVIAV